MKEIQLVGNINNFNTTFVGFFAQSKLDILNNIEEKDFYLLTKEKLVDFSVNNEIIKSRLILDNYLIATKLQNKIIANIFDLIDKGYKKIAFYELLTFIDSNVRVALINYLNVNKIRFINITNDMEDALLTDYLVVFYDGKVALEGNTLDVLKEEKLLNRMGISLPFMVDLSIQLKYYGLVDKIYLNKEELVDVLWK